MVFQPIRCTAPGVAIGTGELLPRLFTLAFDYAQADLRHSSGGYFLLHYYTLTDIFPLGSMVLFVARTFLPDLSEAEGRIDGTACCNAKVRKCSGFEYAVHNNGYFCPEIKPPNPPKGGLVIVFLKKQLKSGTGPPSGGLGGNNYKSKKFSSAYDRH